MSYHIKYAEEARRALPDVPGNYRRRIRRTIEALQVEPRPPEAKPLLGRPTRFRIRMDRWRVVDEVDDAESTVHVLRIRLKSGPETYESLG